MANVCSIGIPGSLRNPFRGYNSWSPSSSQVFLSWPRFMRFNAAISEHLWDADGERTRSAEMRWKVHGGATSVQLLLKVGREVSANHDVMTTWRADSTKKR